MGVCSNFKSKCNFDEREIWIIMCKKTHHRAFLKFSYHWTPIVLINLLMKDKAWNWPEVAPLDDEVFEVMKRDVACDSRGLVWDGFSTEVVAYHSLISARCTSRHRFLRRFPPEKKKNGYNYWCWWLVLKVSCLIGNKHPNQLFGRFLKNHYLNLCFENWLRIWRPPNLG